MTDLGLKKYFLGLEITQRYFGIFVSQEAYAKDILKKSKMEDCNPITTPMELDMKLSKFEGGDQGNASEYLSLVRSLQYFTCTRPTDGIVSRFMQEPRC